MDKPSGPTSHDVVARARRALGVRRVGHTGTLDPFASGLLLLCIGRATRISQFVTGLDKRYEATARLGVATDTEDVEGAVVSESDGWRKLDARTIEEALGRLTGSLLQVPPRFSAKKVGGEAAHRRARRGEDVSLPPVQVTIHEVSLLEVELPDVRFGVHCSSGTYIRSLARDLGEALGVGAHLTALRRTAVGDFRVEGALTPEALEDPERVAEAWISPARALAHLPRLEVDDAGAGELDHGRPVTAEGLEDGPEVVALHQGSLVAVGRSRDGRFHPRKVFPRA